MADEKRLYPRFNFDCPAQCAFLESFPKTFNVTVTNINPEGIGLMSDVKLDMGITLYLLMDIEEDEPVKFLVKVRWSKEIPNSKQFFSGVKIFDGNMEDQEKFVRAFYKQLVPQTEQRRKILIIKHDKISAHQLQAELAKIRYDVICTYDGESGYSTYLTERPDLVIMNLTLPQLDGYGVVRKIRKLQADQTTPVMMITDNGKAAEKVIKDAIGVQKCVVKPYKISSLLEMVEELMHI